MSSRTAVLALAAALLLQAVNVRAQATNPPYVGRMPSAARLKADIKGADAADTSARYGAALVLLSVIVENLARVRPGGLTPDEKRLIAGYTEARHRLDSPPGAFYLRDPAFRDELLRRYFPAEVRAEYYRVTGKRPPDPPGAAAVKSPAAANPAAAKGALDLADYSYRLGVASEKAGNKKAATGQFAAAVENYKQAIEYDPTLTRAYLSLGNIYMNHQINYELAVPVWKRLIALTPDNASIHALLGTALYQLKRYDEALAAFRHATLLNASPDVLAIAHYNIGLTHLKMGQKEKALEAYRKLQTIDQAEAQKLYAKINEATGSRPAAKGSNAANPPAGGAGQPSPKSWGAKAATATPSKSSQPKAAAGGGTPLKGNSAPTQGGANQTSPPQSATAPKDAALDLPALQAKAERGDAAAQYKLAEYHFSRINVAEGDKWLRKAAEGGNPDAQNSLGFRHLTGNQGGPANVEEGRKWLKKAGAQGHGAALGHLCGSYVEQMNLRQGAVPLGDFPPPPVASSRQDVTEALNWCGKSANEGNAMSQYNLGLLYAKGSADFKPDYEKAYFWLSVRNAPAAKAFREKVGQHLTPEKRAEVEQKAREFRAAGKTPRAP